MKNSRRQVVVVGAGVMGLSCAVRLQEAGFSVRLAARDFPPETTSDIAAAVWYPFHAFPPERVHTWAKQSFRVFQRLASETGNGVHLETVTQLFTRPEPKDPDWRDPLYDFKRLGKSELADPFLDGWTVRVPIIETPLYMPYLLDWGRRLGVRMEQCELHDLAALCTENRLVVNCTGLGSARLAGDDSLYPIRGQVLKVEAQDLPYYFDDSDPNHPFYILPRERDCVLGGTAEHGNDDLHPDPATNRDILDGCARLHAPIRGARIIGAYVGLRPGRKQVRLEREPGASIIHNYGHGGAGFTLSWGCAEEVLRLADIWSRNAAEA